jgi:1A family penicillin-binding protein
MKRSKSIRKHIKKHGINLAWLGLSFGIFLLSLFFIWIATLKTPDFKAFNDRVVASSTKIYDRTGEVLLYDIHENIKRSVVPIEDINIYVKNATVAIEDDEFYNHNGVRPKAFIRAVLANLQAGEFSQGGSTLTQQIVKNTLLTQDKRVSRKLKEWILAIKVEQEFSKEEILEIYLNEAPYGGSVYGIQEASKMFFGVDAADLTLAQSAYLAAIPNAPTFFSPYGQNKDRLDVRKDLVLSRMSELGFITDEELLTAQTEEVEFLPRADTGIRAPHFVFWVREYLENKYGEDVVLRGGLTVRTTLDWDLQEKAEEVVAKHAEINEEAYNASNAALVSIDPQSGQVLAMVGSRNYFDEEIDGNFNVATAQRQPGSSFKPFVYAAAIDKGYEPDTVVFDTKTEFNPNCAPDGSEEEGGGYDCYHPQNYDSAYKGPLSLREALAQSRNVPSVKLLYLVGIRDAIRTAQNLGISTLTDPDRYGLTLVLGGGEVRLLEMTSAYGVFAAEGVRHQPTGIIEIQKQDGSILESYRERGAQVLTKETAVKVNSILSDNIARAPLFGGRLTNFMNFGSIYDVAGKTGTTNGNVDAWMMGYSPELVTGVWSGNNDNTPMTRGSTISGALWREYMDFALTKTDGRSFTPITESIPLETKSIIRGQWRGGESVLVDSISGGLATEYTPQETITEIVQTDVHSILHWVNKRDPLGEYPADPTKDSQYINWEFGVLNWWAQNSANYPEKGGVVPTFEDTIHTPANRPVVSFLSPTPASQLNMNQSYTTSIAYSSPINRPLMRVDYFIDNTYLGSVRSGSTNFTFTPTESNTQSGTRTLKALVYDEVYNKSEVAVQITIN